MTDKSVKRDAQDDLVASVRETLSLLSDRPFALDASRREQRDARIERALAARLRANAPKSQFKGRVAVTVGGAFACAAALALWFGTRDVRPAEYLTIHGHVTAVSGQSQSELPLAPNGETRLALPFDGELQVSERATFRLEDGLSIDLQAAAVEVEALRATHTRRLNLRRGLATCHVPKLDERSSFHVATPEATVVVHGTVFSVERTFDDRAGAGKTCVRVVEGRVEVQHRGGQTFLNASESWGCAQTATQHAARAVGDLPIASPESADPTPKSERETQPTLTTETAENSTLAEQAAALQRALSAERAGRYNEARNEFERLLRTYPGSPLVPEIQDGLARLNKK
jgi:ferric-dicitrate binding protein FerR (iron transport regulator)